METARQPARPHPALLQSPHKEDNTLCHYPDITVGIGMAVLASDPLAPQTTPLKPNNAGARYQVSGNLHQLAKQTQQCEARSNEAPVP